MSGITVSGYGNFSIGGGTLEAGAAFSTSQPLTLSGSGGYGNLDPAGYVVTLSGPLSGPGGLDMVGGGTLILSGSDTYSGGTTISAGTTKLGSSAALPSGTAATVNGTLDLSTFGATLGALTGAGTVNHSGSGSSALTVGSGNASGDFAGTIENTGGRLGLLKTGSGELILSGSDGFSGGTTVNAGKLCLTSSNALAAGTSLTVGSSGTLLLDPALSAAPSAMVAAVPEPGTLAP